jgi:hypothetical protein
LVSVSGGKGEQRDVERRTFSLLLSHATETDHLMLAPSASKINVCSLSCASQVIQQLIYYWSDHILYMATVNIVA